MSVSSFDYESSSEGIQPYLHEPNLFKATVAYDSKHELEEATNEHGKVDQKTSNANWCQSRKCCSMLFHLRESFKENIDVEVLTWLSYRLAAYNSTKIYPVIDVFLGILDNFKSAKRVFF